MPSSSISSRSRPDLPFFVLTTLAAFAAAAVVLAAGGATPAAAAHLALAAGVLPLIAGAMLHFVPVLTRGRSAAAPLLLLPAGLLGAGGAVTVAFLWPSFHASGIRFAVLAALTFSLSLAVWIVRRARTALGGPHPGLAWYVAALTCLLLALVAVLAMDLFPAARTALRRLHLHLNLLGFVGLTALGTLAVLLPTAAGRADPQAALWLRRKLPWALTGVLLVALGAAWWRPAALAGAVLLSWVAVSLGSAWLRRFAPEICRGHGAAPALALALAGFLLLLAAGVLHGGGRLEGTAAVGGFLGAFLLPLVTGAVSQLLPLWLVPGAQTAWHHGARAALGRFAVLRGLTFLAAGLGLALGAPAAAWLAVAALALFALQVAGVFLRR